MLNATFCVWTPGQASVCEWERRLFLQEFQEEVLVEIARKKLSKDGAEVAVYSIS